MNYDHNKNIQDIDGAIRIGRQVIESLEIAEESLNSAKNWGIADMLGGGFITSMIKHSKINNANNELDHTKTLIHQFKQKVGTIHFNEELSIDIGGFAVFADYFFDGLIADWYVQSKINDNREKVQRVKQQMREAVKRLNDLRTYEQSHLR